MIHHEGLSPQDAGSVFENTIVAGRFYPDSVIGRVAGYTVELFDGRNLQDVIEEFAEANLRQAIDGGIVNPREIYRDIRGYEKRTGSSVMDPRYVYQPGNPVKLIEGFYKLARGYAMSGVRTCSLPPTVNRGIEMQSSLVSSTLDAGTALASDLAISGDLKDAPRKVTKNS